MPDLWTFCRSCGARLIGEYEKCPLCDSANVHVENIEWLKNASATGDFFPTKEEGG
jgi:hypothetical protein